MGRSDVNDPSSARRQVIAYKNNSSLNPAPLPMEECPWCGTGFKPESFRLVPDDKAPINLEIRCAERSCAFTRERRLPIIAVDEPIYDRLPAFMIATADKFAALPWTGETARFFGRISRDRELPPPELIIQDELHLISGPLGTMAGLYERAIDLLARREDDEGRYPPQDHRLNRHGPPARSGRSRRCSIATAPRSSHRPVRTGATRSSPARYHPTRSSRASTSVSPPRVVGRRSCSCAPPHRSWRRPSVSGRPAGPRPITRPTRT